MVAPLDRKLLRDLLHLRGQVITIALVVACGIAAFVTLRTTFSSLLVSRSIYYDRYRFADVFVHLERAPDALKRDLEAIAGVSSVATRIWKEAMVPLPALPEPVSATLISLPGGEQPELDAIHIGAGRMIEPGRADEVVVLQTFADANRLRPGDSLPVVINQTRRELRIVGTALSPEFVFPMSASDLAPDPTRFVVLWLDQAILAPVFQMEGAFNDVLLKLGAEASRPEVMARVDRLLEPYGGLGAIAQEKQWSNLTLSDELGQLESAATIVPIIFLGVAAFLLNVVLSRLVSLQRPEIAALKALGYRDREIGVHYLKLVLLIVLLGAVAGVSAGAWLGRLFVEYYGTTFHFPVLRYRLDPGEVASSVWWSALAAMAGAIGAVRQVSRLPPAEALRPAAPASYGATLLDRWRLFHVLSPPSRIVLREVLRRPVRVLLSSVAIALAIGILVVARFWGDSMDYLIRIQFHGAMREDLTVSFLKPLPARAIRDLSHVPGVLRAEGQRVLPVRYRKDHHYRDSVLYGHQESSDLRRILDQQGRPAALPSNGILLTRKLGEILDAREGDQIELEVREGRRGRFKVRVAGWVDESFGIQGHMKTEELHRLLREEPAVSLALLTVDPTQVAETRRRLKEMRSVSSVTRLADVVRRFEDQSGTMMMVMTSVLTLFATVIAIGVVYNNARVALSMRSRELASLRVIGFTKGEIAEILISELGLQVLLAAPLGLLVGTGLAKGLASMADPETYRMPAIISVHSYAFAIVVTLLSAVVSGLMVRRKLNNLDLVGVLKVRE